MHAVQEEEMMKNLFGEEQCLPNVWTTPAAWREGWRWGMDKGYYSNPYEERTPEWYDWIAGYNSAIED